MTSVPTWAVLNVPWDRLGPGSLKIFNWSSMDSDGSVFKLDFKSLPWDVLLNWIQNVSDRLKNGPASSLTREKLRDGCWVTSTKGVKLCLPPKLRLERAGRLRPP